MIGSRPPWLVTGVLSLSGLVAALNGTVMLPLVPLLPDLLDVAADDAAWLVTGTIVSGAVLIPTVARLADMFGRRLLLIVCLLVMSAGSALSAVSDDFWLVLVGRLLAGLGVPLIPVGMTVLRDALPPERVGSAVALMSATLGIGGGIGLPLSGVLYEQLGWHSVFWVTGLAAAVLAVLVIVVVPRTLRRHGGRFDPFGAVLLAIGTASVMLVISKGGSWGWASPLTLGFALAAALATAAWVVIEWRIRDPLVDLRVSAGRVVLLTNIASLLIGFGMFINLLLAMQQLQAPPETGYGQGLSVLQASLLMVSGGLVMVLVAPIAGRLITRRGGRLVLIIGAGTMAAGYVLRVFLGTEIWQIVVGTTVVSLGTSFAFGAMPSLILGSVPSSMAAAGTGLNTLIRQIGTSSSSSAVAASLAVEAVVLHGIAYPSWSSIVILNVIAGGCCLAGAVLAVGVPRPRPSESPR